VIYIIALIVGFWGYYEPAAPGWPRRAGGHIVIWILIGLLGYHVFGPVIR